MIKNLILSGVMIIGFHWAAHSQSVEVTVTNIRNTEGNIRIAVFTDNDSFEKEEPLTVKIFPKTNIIGGTMVATIFLSPGTYGFALLDDENQDGNMSYNLIGWPKEGFGFSNYYETGLSKPDFSKFSFVLKNEKKKVAMGIRYM